MDYAPWIRISLRYIIGAGLFGSTEIGELLATDPDLIAAGCVLVGFIIETAYVVAKRRGWRT